MKTGIHLISAERERQVSAEGWTPEHDDTHHTGELVNAAIAYADVAASQVVVGGSGETYGPHDDWPWSLDWWKPSDDPLRNLVKAGALIAAEIDRLSRQNAAPSGGDRDRRSATSNVNES